MDYKKRLAGQGGPNVLVLVPDCAGGMRGLFEQLQAHEGEAGAAGEAQIAFFASHDAKPGKHFRLPGRLVAFARTLVGGRVDLCHINVAVAGSVWRKMAFAVVCRWLGVPYVIHLHGSSFDRYARSLPPLARARVARFFDRAAYVIVLGSVWKQVVVDHLGVAPENVVILDNAVAPVSAGAHHNTPPHIVFLGQLGARKGVHDLIAALGALRHLDWRTTIAGDGDIDLYRDEIARLGLSDRIVCTGWIGRSAAQNLLAAGDIFALPSHAENQPLALLEAMSAGLGIVTTPVGAISETIIAEENGLIVAPGDRDGLAIALSRLIGEPTLRQRLGTSAKAEFSDRFDIARYRTRLEAIYRAACS